MIKKLFAAALVAVTLGGCAGLQKVADVAGATVPAALVIPAANGFDILKSAATNYGRYCIAQKRKLGSWKAVDMPVACSAEVRRTVIKFVRSGTAARNQLETSIETGQPAAASVYNVLVSAVDGLRNSPVNSPQFVAGGG